MPLNHSVMLLERDENSAIAIKEALDEIGQRKFISLARSSQQSRMALAMYSGDGLVTKVIPANFLSHTTDIIYHLPSISTHFVEGKNNNFIIKTYPWVSPGGVTDFDVETMRSIVRNVGLEFTGGDDKPKNVHRMPDFNQTLVGIDSDMFKPGVDGVRINDEMRQAWHSYVWDLFPIYRDGMIPAQTSDTDFSLVSRHDRSAEKKSFVLPGSRGTLAQGTGQNSNFPAWNPPEM